MKTMSIMINADFHEATKNSAAHSAEAIATAQERVVPFLSKLLKAANESYPEGTPDKSFQVLPLDTSNLSSKETFDIVILHQNFTSEGDVTRMSVADLSFGAKFNPQDRLIAGAELRLNSSLQPTGPGQPAQFMRSPMVNEFYGMENMNEIGDDLYKWVFDQMPPELEETFRQKCVDAGLVAADKPVFGFGTTPSHDEPPSQAIH